MSTTTLRDSIQWGETLVVAAFRSEGGLKRAAEVIRRCVGPQMGTRNTFAKLYRVNDLADLDDLWRFRAWLVITALGAQPADFGLSDADVPPVYDVTRLNRELRTRRDSNSQPSGLRSHRFGVAQLLAA